MTIGTDSIKAILLAAWDGAAMRALNSWVQDVSRVLTGNLMLTKHAYTQIVTPQIIPTQTVFPLKLATKFQSRPLAVFVAYCIDTDASPPVSVAAGNPAWSWTGQLSIDTLPTGLTSGHRHTLGLLVVGG